MSDKDKVVKTETLEPDNIEDIAKKLGLDEEVLWEKYHRALGAGTKCVVLMDRPQDIFKARIPDRPDWDTYFLTIAEVVSYRADCRRRQVGCVIVGDDHRIMSTGYNGAPAGDEGCLTGACPRGLLSYDQIKEFTDYDSGPGRCISLHAEANALLYAGKMVRGATAYITDKPCPTCEKLLKGAGIVRAVYGRPLEWGQDIYLSATEKACGHHNAEWNFTCTRNAGHEYSDDKNTRRHGYAGVFWF